MDTIDTISPRMLAYRLVHIVSSDLQLCEELSIAFRIEGFETNFSTNSEQFMFLSKRRMPDVVVLSLALDQESGIPFLRGIKREIPGVAVVALAAQGQVDAAVLAMKFGAFDVVTLPIDIEHLMGTVRDCLRKDIHVAAMHHGVRKVEVRGFSSLTRREREVLDLLTNGHSNKTAADKLEISPRTIEVYRANVMRKLGASNTADLMRIVFTS